MQGHFRQASTGRFKYGEVNRWVFQHTNCALTGPVQSPFMSIWFCIYTPSLVVYPTFALLSYRYAPLTSWWYFTICSGNSYNGYAAIASVGEQHIDHRLRHIARQTFSRFYMRTEARRCIYLKAMAPPFSLTGVRRSGAIMSMPCQRPMIFAMRSHITIFSGCISSVTSVDVPPVERLAVGFNKTCSPFAGTVSML